MSRGLVAFALACLITPAARAETPRFPFPDPIWCDVPSHIVLVGYGPAGPDSVYGHFEVVLRDHWSVYPNVTVLVDLGANGSLRPASDQLDPRLRVDCAHHLVRTMTDAHGVASFTIIGGGSTAPQLPHIDKAMIACDYFNLRSVPVSALDLDGQNGVTLADLKYWAADFFSGEYSSRSDYDGSSTLTLGDLSIWAQAYFAAGSVGSSTLCP